MNDDGIELAQPDLTWDPGAVPRALRFDDTYYAGADGLGETRYVFLGGNDLPARFAPGFHIAELGFGTGLSALAAWESWRAAGIAGPLRFTSFEAEPMAQDDRRRALAAFPGLRTLAEPLMDALPKGLGRAELPGLCLTVIGGDARRTLPRWDGLADAWFLDGFSPARNPSLWEPPLLAEVYAHTRQGGSFATYTAAGAVRRALATAGFAVDRVAGFGRKRHMTRGWRG